MIRSASAAAAMLVLATACGHQAQPAAPPKAESGVRGASTTAVRHDHGLVVKIYEVGKDIDPGVYTTESRGCTAVATTTAGYDLLADNPDPDGIVATSVSVGKVERIVLRRGAFFQVEDCGLWQREIGDGPQSPDPSTVAGACAILVQGRLLDEVAAFLREPDAAPADGSAGSILQERLMAVVTSNLAARGPLKALSNSSGQLVDLIDDPYAYHDLDSRTSREVGRIRAVCRR